MKRSKISIIGTGMVGSATAFSLLQSGVALELLLIDKNKDRAEGEAMDLSHGVPLAQAVNVRSGEYADLLGSDIVIITAGAPQKDGETRLDLVHKNTAIMKDIIPNIVAHAPDSILIVVTNPVDVLTYAALQISGLPDNRVMGSGTVLDTSRLRYALSQEAEIDTRNIHAYVLGEHGDTEFVAWSRAHVAGTPLDEYFEDDLEKPLTPEIKEELARQVRDAAYEVIEKKKATYYAVALALNRICRAILRGERSILTVSTSVHGIYGAEDVCLSIPCVVGRGGIERKIPFHLNDEEVKNWQKSASAMAEFTRNLPLNNPRNQAHPVETVSASDMYH